MPRLDTPTTARVAVAVVTLASCAFGAEERARTIPDSQQVVFVDMAATDIADTGVDRIYLQQSDPTGHSTLVAVQRDVGDDPLHTVTVLLDGPTTSEQEIGLRSAIPRGTELNSANFVSTDTVRIDLGDSLFDATGDDLVSALAQIVLTMCEISGVRRVMVVVDGEARDWPRGDGTLTSEPLTRYDYPGRAISSQPAYPGVVSLPGNG